MKREADSFFLRLTVIATAFGLLVTVTAMGTTVGQDTQEKHDPVQWSLKTDVATRPV
jgi:hypothetical protein